MNERDQLIKEILSMLDRIEDAEFLQVLLTIAIELSAEEERYLRSQKHKAGEDHSSPVFFSSSMKASITVLRAIRSFSERWAIVIANIRFRDLGSD